MKKLLLIVLLRGVSFFIKIGLLIFFMQSAVVRAIDTTMATGHTAMSDTEADSVSSQQLIDLVNQYVKMIEHEDDTVFAKIDSLKDALWKKLVGIKIPGEMPIDSYGTVNVDYSLLGSAIVLGSMLTKPFQAALVNTLIRKGVEIDEIYNVCGWKTTILGLATIFCHKNIIEQLLDAGASIDGKPGTDVPLVVAAFHKKSEIVQLLINRGAKVNIPEYMNGRTCLCAAVEYESVESVRSLLEKGAWIDQQQGYNGNTPLHIAAANGNTEIASMLIEKGAAVESFNKKKQTPLFFAVQRGHVRMVDLLLKHGADVNLKINFSWSVADMVDDPKMTWGDLCDLIATMSLVGLPPLEEQQKMLCAMPLFEKASKEKQVDLLRNNELLNGMFPLREHRKMLSDNMTPLLLASILDKSQVVVALLGAGADCPAINGVPISAMLKILFKNIATEPHAFVKILERRECLKQQKYEQACEQGTGVDDVEELLKQLGETGRGEQGKKAGKKGKKDGRKGAALDSREVRVVGGESLGSTGYESSDEAASDSRGVAVSVEGGKNSGKPVKRGVGKGRKGAALNPRGVSVALVGEGASPVDYDCSGEAASDSQGAWVVARARGGDSLSSSCDTNVVTFSVSCEGADVPVAIHFDQTFVTSLSNKITLDKTAYKALLQCCKHDEEEAADGRFFWDKRPETRGGCMLLAARVQDYLSAKISNTPEFDRGARDYIINHAFTIKMLMNALRYGATYLEITNDAARRLSLLVVAPINDRTNRFITLCFGVSDDGQIRHCYHCCRQRNHPRDVRDGGDLKYKLTPIQVNATMPAGKLEFSFPPNAFGVAKHALFSRS